MEFLYILLNFIGFIFYIVAIIGAFLSFCCFFILDDDDSPRLTSGLIAAILGLIFWGGGYGIRNYSEYRVEPSGTSENNL